MRPHRFLLVLTTALLLAACGDDAPPHHGLKVDDLPDTPTGDEVLVAYDFEPGERWTAELLLEARQEKKEGRNAENRKAGALSTYAFEQRYVGGDPPKSETRLRYVSIQSVDGEDIVPPKGVTLGRFLHQASGRPDPTSLRLSGDLVAENQTLFRSLLLAGLGGTDAWLPDHPVRPGSAWRAADTIDPQAIKAMSAIAQQPGATLPPATIQGTVRFERLEDGPEGKVLVLRIDILLEMEGPVTSGRHRADLSLGYRVEGTAHVDARTGIAVQLDTKSVMDLSQKGGGDEMTWRLELTLSGRAMREDR